MKYMQILTGLNGLNCINHVIPFIDSCLWLRFQTFHISNMFILDKLALLPDITYLCKLLKFTSNFLHLAFTIPWKRHLRLPWPFTTFFLTCLMDSSIGAILCIKMFLVSVLSQTLVQYTGISELRPKKWLPIP